MEILAYILPQSAMELRKEIRAEALYSLKTREELIKTADSILAKVLKWGDEPCPHDLFGEKAILNKTRRECDLCWSDLKAEAEMQEVSNG